MEDYNLTPDTSLEYFSKVLPNLGVGLYLTHKNLHISMAATRMLNTERTQEEEGRAVFAKDRLHYYTSLMYKFDISSTTSFNTIAVTRLVQAHQCHLIFREDSGLVIMWCLTVHIEQTSPLLAFCNCMFMTTYVGWAYESNSRSELANAGNSQRFMHKYRFN